MRVFLTLVPWDGYEREKLTWKTLVPWNLHGLGFRPSVPVDMLRRGGGTLSPCHTYCLDMARTTLCTSNMYIHTLYIHTCVHVDVTSPRFYLPSSSRFFYICRAIPNSPPSHSESFIDIIEAWSQQTSSIPVVEYGGLLISPTLVLFFSAHGWVRCYPF